MAFVTVPLGGGLGHCVEHLKSAGTQKRDLQVKSLNSLDIIGRCAQSNSQRNSKLIKNRFSELVHCAQQIPPAHPTTVYIKCLSLDDLQTRVSPICNI